MAWLKCVLQCCRSSHVGCVKDDLNTPAVCHGCFSVNILPICTTDNIRIFCLLPFEQKCSSVCFSKFSRNNPFT